MGAELSVRVILQLLTVNFVFPRKLINCLKHEGTCFDCVNVWSCPSVACWVFKKTIPRTPWTTVILLIRQIGETALELKGQQCKELMKAGSVELSIFNLFIALLKHTSVKFSFKFLKPFSNSVLSCTSCSIASKSLLGWSLTCCLTKYFLWCLSGIAKTAKTRKQTSLIKSLCLSLRWRFVRFFTYEAVKHRSCCVIITVDPNEKQ